MHATKYELCEGPLRLPTHLHESSFVILKMFSNSFTLLAIMFAASWIGGTFIKYLLSYVYTISNRSIPSGLIFTYGLEVYTLSAKPITIDASRYRMHRKKTRLVSSQGESRF